MPIIKSAKKRVRVARKATARNVKTKRSLRSALKSFASKATGSSHAKAQSTLDKAGKKGVLHKNKVARKKRQLAANAKKAGVKTAGAKKTAAKSASQRTAAKKVVKKAAPKKVTTAKKPVAKKSAPKKKTTKK